ncbi:SDR family NAD(P)-dependent oxidoreductase [Sulfitobacter sp. F26204]|uniref:SDR family NAD(P)-dependent oxidoreductase n=1 Tax=Sulfitobacter sp. F26204 TaxID=2996014 RepID=UPI00225E646F|nr:SDR family oxidoreductase [Sulfitobacter sp. F26204]MCX7558376.1 SDR family NAD(P)-dependent oxidoreductase [Sulfitobacter sp. F26204]
MNDGSGTTKQAATVGLYADLKGKSVFITGGGSGIGAAVTEAFVKQGAKVAFVQRSDGSAFCDVIEASHGVRPVFIQCDITDIPALKDAMGRVGILQGPIDILVNNAANDQRHRTEDVDEAFWDRAMAINLKAYFFAAQTAIEQMKSNGAGTIINFSSVAYMAGMAGFPVYTSSNAAIVSLTQSLAREFGPAGIRVNALAPGMVITPRQLDLWLTDESISNQLANQCLPEALAPEDIVGAVLFLASGASRMMTGQTLIVDGGFIARA